MLDHVFVSVSDLDRSIEFYERALAPLGIRHAVDYDGANGPEGHPDLKGFGRDGRVFFWLRHGSADALAVHGRGAGGPRGGANIRHSAGKSYPYSSAKVCRECRRREQVRKAEARRVHLDGLARKKDGKSVDFKIYPDAGHGAQFQYPDRFVKHAIQFLDE